MSNYYLKKEKYYWGKIFLDGIFLLAAFLLVYYIWRGHVRIEVNFRKLLPFLFVTWFVVTLFSSKYKYRDSQAFYSHIKSIFVSVLIFSALLTLELYILDWYYLSRFIIYFTIGVFLIFEIFYRTILVILRGKIKGEKPPFPSTWLLYVELILFFIILSVLYVYHKKVPSFNVGYLVFTLGISFGWILISLQVHNYKLPNEKNICRLLFPFWKSEIIILLTVTFFLYLTLLTEFPRFLVICLIVGFSLVENLMVILLSLLRKKMSIEEKTIVAQPEDVSFIEKLSMEICDSFDKGEFLQTGKKESDGLFAQKLKKVYLSKRNGLYDFISENINIHSIDIMKAHVVSLDAGPVPPEILNEPCSFVLNFAEFNHSQRLNQKFIEINKKIQKNGILVGCFKSLRQNKDGFYQRNPKSLATISYFFHFVYRRIFPKLLLIRKMYFLFTKGRNRVISVAEMLGRLAFCGFKIRALKEIDNKCWFIAEKKTPHLEDKHPSYGMIFKQKRIGNEGKEIQIFKLRTMYPYSEYLHDFVVRKFSLNEISKIHDDFRITGWGKFLRKYWIDEFPMVINLIRGDVKLVGVRPLSFSLYDTYPDSLKKQRNKAKPGIMPPFYADMPENMDAVYKSELDYLTEFLKNPIKTDVKYFFKITKNILFHHAQSG